MGNLPPAGPIVYLIIRVLRAGVEAVLKITPKTFLELEGALCVWKVVFLLLQFGIIVGELVEQNGNGHAIEDDAKGDAAECDTAAEIGDRDNISVAHSGDANLQKETYSVSSHKISQNSSFLRSITKGPRKE